MRKSLSTEGYLYLPELYLYLGGFGADARTDTQHSHRLKVKYVFLARSHYIQVSKVIFVKELVLPHEWVQFMGFIIFISPISRVPFSQIRTVSCIWVMQTRHLWWPRCFLPMSRQGLGRKCLWPSSCCFFFKVRGRSREENRQTKNPMKEYQVFYWIYLPSQDAIVANRG